MKTVFPDGIEGAGGGGSGFVHPSATATTLTQGQSGQNTVDSWF